MLEENISVQDENLTAYIEAKLGPSHVNWSTLLPLTIIYSIFLIIGVCGNLVTCIVIMSNEYMRTPTNVYLLNLAIADIATLVISKFKTVCKHALFKQNAEQNIFYVLKPLLVPI